MDPITTYQPELPEGRAISPRWLIAIGAILLAGIASAILSSANPPRGDLDISAGKEPAQFRETVPVFSPPAYDDYFVEERHEGEGIPGDFD